MTLATNGDPNAGASSDQIKHFADALATLSDKKLVVEPEWSAVDEDHNWDQATAQLVIDGTDNLGLIPARAWDVLGVSSLQALSAPMLITDEALEKAVLTSDLGDSLLSGLPDAGVSGLALFPDSLRHTFALKGPLVRPSDFDGGIVNVPTSNASTAMYDALGATASDSDIDAATIGQDTAFGPEGHSAVAGNLTWYPRFNVLVGNSDVLDGLTDEQRGWLDEASADTQQWAIDNLPSEADAAADWCAQGGTIVAASANQLAAFAAAVEPVRRSLAEDPLTASAIAEIEALKATTTPEDPVTACP